MASSRLEKIGTIFSRTTGLLRTGALKLDDKPIWYEVYAAFPPHQEPRYDRPAPNIPVKQIFYEEDKIRAKFHKYNKNVGIVTLDDTKNQSQTQCFIENYNKLKQQGALDEEKIFEVAQDLVREKFNTKSETVKGLVSSFSDAHTANLDIKNIFKD